jgi:1,5-anhydro-D-fructose reductase (1,5-anhydro-D-mannitol-forming)
VRIGICGFGKMGQIRADAIEALGIGKIVKVFDVAYEAEPRYPKATSIDEIVLDPDIDAVFVCTPNWLNKPTTLKALQTGKHVFCEKPPAFNGTEMREIIAAEKASGKVLMYGFNHRHHEAIRKMHELIASGEYGRVIWMRGRYGKSVDANYLDTWRADPKLAGGGILMDQGIHMLDLMLYIADQPFDEVKAMVSNLYWHAPGIEDNVFALFRNNSTGVSASIHSTMTQWRHLFSFEVFLERGYMVVNGLKTSSGTYGDEVLTVARNRSTAPAATWEDEVKHRYETDSSWSSEVQMFADAVTGKGEVRLGSSDHALAVLDLIDRIYEEDRHHSDILHVGLIGDDPSRTPAPRTGSSEAEPLEIR